MMLGKRQRAPMKRTTSMTQFTLDLRNTDVPGEVVVPYSDQSQPFNDPQNPFHSGTHHPAVADEDQQHKWFAFSSASDSRVSSAAPSRTARRYSADSLDRTTHFLRACALCKRRLIPRRDIYMYRGDSAFCSLECRQQKMNQDERKEKCSLASKMGAVNSVTASEVSTTNETVAAL